MLSIKAESLPSRVGRLTKCSYRSGDFDPDLQNLQHLFNGSCEGGWSNRCEHPPIVQDTYDIRPTLSIIRRKSFRHRLINHRPSAPPHPRKTTIVHDVRSTISRRNRHHCLECWPALQRSRSRWCALVACHSRAWPLANPMKELAVGSEPWYGYRYSARRSSLNDIVRTVAREQGEHGGWSNATCREQPPSSSRVEPLHS